MQATELLRSRFGGKNEWKDDDLITAHHRFMEVYGWVPFDEFINEIPIPTFLNLCKEIQKDNEERSKKMKRKRG